jgi:hypothetical protein
LLADSRCTIGYIKRVTNSFVIESSCHCGAVKLQIDGEIPSTLNSCNCSICRRYGGLVAYYPPTKVKILASPDSMDEYVWGDKTLALVRCRKCGCFSHWRSLDPDQTDRMGINARLFTNVEIDKIRIRHFDGENSWKYLD